MKSNTAPTPGSDRATPASDWAFWRMEDYSLLQMMNFQYDDTIIPRQPVRFVCVFPICVYTSLSRSTRHLPSASRLSPRPVSARALTPSWEGTTARIYPNSIRRSRCSSGIVRWLGRFLISFKEANSSAVRRGLFRNEKGKCFLIRQICAFQKMWAWVDSQRSTAPQTPHYLRRSGDPAG